MAEINKKQTKNKREAGALWEERAARYLEGLGYRIEAMNYRCHLGEADIIAWEQDMLVFVEVKYRSSRQFGSALEAVTPGKQRILRRVAMHYLSCVLRCDRIPCRFDVVAFDDGRDVPQLVRDAF